MAPLSSSQLEAPSQLPAEILTAADGLVKGLETLQQWLRIVRDADTTEAAYRALDHAEHETGRLLETARRQRITIRVAQMPAIAEVAASPLKGERPETTSGLALFDRRQLQAGEGVYHGEERR